MNIFNVLSEGKSRLHESSISAMLGYLLDTTKDHGLGDRFFREFLKLLQSHAESATLTEVLSQPFIKTETELEAAFENDGKRCDIDIAISLAPKYKISFYIENKIRSGAARASQLFDYYNAILSETEPEETVYMIFLTPEENKKHYEEEYNKLAVKKNHRKVWLFWSSQEGGILNLFVNILQRDAVGEIDPINEYLRHTIKAFVSHIKARLLREKVTHPYFGEDIGQVVEEVNFESKDGSVYKIVLRDSSQIQVFRGDEKMVAKEILRKIIKEKGFDIKFEKNNTRTIGKKVIQHLKTHRQ